MGAAAAIVLAAQVLTLEQALKAAQEHQPQLHQASATTNVFRARADEALYPLLPQFSGVAAYTRATGNFVQRAGALPPSVSTSPTASTHSNFDTFNFFNFGLSLNQLIWDFGYTYKRWYAARELTHSQEATELASRLQVALGVRTTYYAARAQRSLLQVARETLTNQERHLGQIQGFVTVGTRPEIDLAQARTDRANARVQVINAENGYETGKAQLNQAMGVEGPTDYDVGDEPIEALPGETENLDDLVNEAIKHRPELVSLQKQIESQRLSLSAQKGAYGPALAASSSLTDAGQDITAMGWNWNAQLTLTWNISGALLTKYQVDEARANLDVIAAQLDAARQGIRLEVDQARLAVRAGKEALSASEEALVNARERLKLAEGRYQAGVGNIIELGDAQLAFTSASAQRVQAEYTLSTARAQLEKALGRF